MPNRNSGIFLPIKKLSARNAECVRNALDGFKGGGFAFQFNLRYDMERKFLTFHYGVSERHCWLPNARRQCVREQVEYDMVVIKEVTRKC